MPIWNKDTQANLLYFSPITQRIHCLLLLLSKMASDDNVMMKQIVGTHAPDGREVEVKSLLLLVQDILKHATQRFDSSETVWYQTHPWKLIRISS